MCADRRSRLCQTEGYYCSPWYRRQNGAHVTAHRFDSLANLLLAAIADIVESRAQLLCEPSAKWTLQLFKPNNGQHDGFLRGGHPILPSLHLSTTRFDNLELVRDRLWHTRPMIANIGSTP